MFDTDSVVDCRRAVGNCQQLPRGIVFSCPLNR